MQRKALIISSYGYDSDFMAGIQKDLDNYSSYLQSPLGGLWREYEINIPKEPSEEAIYHEISSLKKADYSFVVFTGHGYIHPISKSTICCVNESIEIDSINFRAGSIKQTLILDCCRKIEPRLLLEESIHYASAGIPYNPENCRKYFDEKIEASSEGLIVLCACQKNEYSEYKPSVGGLYTASLLNVAREWGKKNTLLPLLSPRERKVYSIIEAHKDAERYVSIKSGGRQNPEIDLLPRSGPYFPFAVLA